MKKFLLFILLPFLFACSKENSAEDVYGYEVECEQCHITYLDANERVVSLRGQSKRWKIDFPNAVIYELDVTAQTLVSNASNMHVYITKNGSRISSHSGIVEATTSYTISSRGGGGGTTASGYCGAPTTKGGSCTRKVAGGGRCWQHK